MVVCFHETVGLSPNNVNLNRSYAEFVHTSLEIEFWVWCGDYHRTMIIVEGQQENRKRFTEFK